MCEWATKHKTRHFIFMTKWRVSGTLEVLVKSSFLWGILMDMRENVLRVLKVYTGERYWERNAEGRLLQFCDKKELCVANTWLYMADKRKITYSAGGSETKTDFVLLRKKYRKYKRDVKVVSWELQHGLVVIDLDKKVVRKQRITRKIWKFFCFTCHIYPSFTRKRIASIYFGRDVRTRLGVAISEVSGPPVFPIKAGASR